MAIGMARVLGVRFPINFFSPPKAVGIVDFYRRWHITLTRVIARFMYVPLSMSGARAAARWKLSKVQMRAIAQWLPLLINFEVIALWHGARLTFLVFGVPRHLVRRRNRDPRDQGVQELETHAGWARATMGRMIFTLRRC
jgi:D-alanyl-lipoteichoic acid acyltransferase DltB (MBOAT superfamily)